MGPYYARRIAQEVKLPSQFSALVPKVREFLETRAFGERVDLSQPAMVKAVGSNVTQYVTGHSPDGVKLRFVTSDRFGRASPSASRDRRLDSWPGPPAQARCSS